MSMLYKNNKKKDNYIIAYPLIGLQIIQDIFLTSKKKARRGIPCGLLNFVASRRTYLVSIVFVVVLVRSWIAGFSVVVVVVFRTTTLLATMRSPSTV